jgi:hypothetical protein
MKTIKKIIKTLIIATSLMYISNNNTVAQDKKQDVLPFSGNINAGIVSNEVLISGKILSEYAIFQCSGNINFGSFDIFGGVKKDKKDIKEIDIGIDYQRKLVETNLGKITGKIAIERKLFPDQNKEMYLSDVVLGANTKLGDLSLLYRERFKTRDYNSGRTIVLNVTTPSANLGKIIGMDSNIKGMVALAYQDKFVNTSEKFGYVTPGLMINLKNKNIGIEVFLKNQRALRTDLKDYAYGGVKVKYSFGNTK